MSAAHVDAKVAKDCASRMSGTSVARAGARPSVARVRVSARRADATSRRDATRARASTRDEGEMVRAMRAQALATNANPSVKAIVDTLAELAEQEFGLANVKFQEVMAKIDECFDFEPTAYASGVGTSRETRNAAGTNSGSCKTFYFAKMRGLSEGAALRLFCEHYEDVANAPSGDSHANIRAFMENGYDGLTFEGEALRAKGAGSAMNNDI